MAGRADLEIRDATAADAAAVAAIYDIRAGTAVTFEEAAVPVVAREASAKGQSWVAGRRRVVSVSVPSPRRPGSMPAGRAG